MSSPATIVETSGNAQFGNSLLIIPDGGPLWTEPESSAIVWQFDTIAALVQQLPASNFPVLIGAADHTVIELLNGRFDTGLQCDDHLAQQNLALLPRFVYSTHATDRIGSTNSDATRIELWFIPRDMFGHLSDGWSSALRRLGFSTPRWRGHESLLQNLQNERIANAIPSASRPSSITLGRFVNRELVTTQYPLGD